MPINSQHFYLFLSACSGNWRNTVFITSKNTPGYLLTADRDGQPLVMAVEQFQQLTGEQIDPAECCGQLSEDGFTSLYTQYLLWHLPSAQEQPLKSLCQRIG